MDEERIAGDPTYRNLEGTLFRTPLRLILAHVFNHQTHHCGQVGDMLSQDGASPPELDLICYVCAP